MYIDTSDASFIFAIGMVVGEQPDRIYIPKGDITSCAYVESDDNGNLCDGCLIGTVLVKMGVPREWFIDNGVNTGNGAAGVLSMLGFSPRIGHAAYLAQNAQDSGETWSVAGTRFIDSYTRSA